MNQKSCKICSKGFTQTEDPLIRICDCNQINSTVHKSCIEKWLELTSQTNCSLCGFRYIAYFCPKSYFEYLKETPEDWEDIQELTVRAVNVMHLTLLGLIICLHNNLWSNYGLFIKVVSVLIVLITLFRIYAITRLWSLFYIRCKFNFKEWQTNHFSVEISPNPKPKQN